MERQQSKRQWNEGRAKESVCAPSDKESNNKVRQNRPFVWAGFISIVLFCFVLFFEILTAHSFSGTNKIPTIHAFRGIKNEIEERTSKSQAKICMCTCARICKITIEKMPTKMKKNS